MFVDQIELASLGGREIQPWSAVFASQIVEEARQLIRPEGQARRSRFSPLASGIACASERLFLGVDSIRPGRWVVDFGKFHMSGLRGLFVWKQKANTEAPGTHNA